MKKCNRGGATTSFHLIIKESINQVSMNLKSLGSNLTLITNSDGCEYLFSYETLVAGYDPDDISETENGYWFVSESYSRTTTRHIKKYLENLYTSPKTSKVTKSVALISQEALM